MTSFPPLKTASKTDFQWVNFDSNNIKKQVERRDGFVHVQPGPRRKRQVFSGQQKPYRLARPDRLTLPTEPHIETRSLSPETSSTDSSVNPRFLTSQDSSTSEEEFATASPIPIRLKGNSDPFDALPVTIDARTNELLCILRDYVIPTLYTLQVRPRFMVDMSVAAWEDSLHMDVTAYAQVARAAGFYAAISPSPKAQQYALVLRNKATRALRSGLIKSDGEATSMNRNLTESIFMLMSVELISKDYETAAVHARALLTLLQNLKPEAFTPATMGRLYMVLYNDVQRAAMSLTRTIFDVSPDGWTARKLTVSWYRAKDFAPNLEMMAKQALSPAIDDPALYNIFLEVRQLGILFALILADTPGVQQSTWYYMLNRITLSEGRLINYFVDMTSDNDHRHTQSNPAREHVLLSNLLYNIRSYTYAYTALAAIYYVRRSGNNDSVPLLNKATIWNAGSRILSSMRRYLQLAQAHQTSDERTRYAPLRLWALFVGAMAEQIPTRAVLEDESTTDKKWFTRKFGEQASVMGLVEWNSVRDVLSGFLYSDRTQPHGSVWFWKATDGTG